MQRGTRQALNQAFLNKLSQDWRKHGDDVIVAAREKDPVGYLRIVASLLPKDHKHLHEPGSGFAEMLVRVNRAVSETANMVDVTPPLCAHKTQAVDYDEN